MTSKARLIATNLHSPHMRLSQVELLSSLRTHSDVEAVESVEVSSKSDAKNQQFVPNAKSVRESLWWMPAVWRLLKWARKRNRKNRVATVRIRKDEEVIIRKRNSPL